MTDTLVERFEPVAWRYISDNPHAKWTVQKNKPDLTAWNGYRMEALIPAAALAAAQAEIERLTRERDEWCQQNTDLQQQIAGQAEVRAQINYAEATATRLQGEVDALKEAMENVARWAWRTDPPNATGKLTDAERFSAIKYHPTVQEFAKPHIELAERETLTEKDSTNAG